MNVDDYCLYMGKSYAARSGSLCVLLEIGRHLDRRTRGLLGPANGGETLLRGASATAAATITDERTRTRQGEKLIYRRRNSGDLWPRVRRMEPGSAGIHDDGWGRRGEFSTN